MNAIVQHQPEQQSEATALIQAIERAAINPAVDVDKMERLLQMQERILARNAEVAFSAAFAEMQSELPVITERGQIVVNDVVRSEYATFEDINEAVKPILHRHGFGVSFRTDFSDGITITAVLTHRQGHREQTSMKLPADTSGSKNVVQAIGSSVSYGKRYTMQALLNITSSGEDDDGEAAGDDSAPNMAEIQRFVSLFTDAFDADVTDEKRDELIFKVHEQLAGKNETYIAVSKLIGKTRKNAIRKHIENYRAMVKEMRENVRRREL